MSATPWDERSLASFAAKIFGVNTGLNRHPTCVSTARPAERYWDSPHVRSPRSILELAFPIDENDRWPLTILCLSHYRPDFVRVDW